MAPLMPSAGPVRVAVLGATGCMGRHLCAAFSAEGSEVVAIARRYAPQVAAHRFLSLDVAGSTSDKLARVLTREAVDVVVNATLGWGDELHYANVQLVERLLGALAKLPAPPRLVHLGTIDEYGPVPFGTSIHEDMAPAPENPYAKAKLTASRMVSTPPGTVPSTPWSCGWPTPWGRTRRWRVSSGPWRSGSAAPTRPPASS
ncbi:NAD-dependent epimerase/dehydratase family protein [Streptomyces sioyaensis]|uniref:NAD-dependent epimerase/dehydratase family protein n=1 Tax=Streptomyces sioyaensis TaxID=67364 RepID=UPI003EBBBA1D